MSLHLVCYITKFEVHNIKDTVGNNNYKFVISCDIPWLKKPEVMEKFTLC